MRDYTALRNASLLASGTRWTDKDREFYERYCENLDRQIDDLVYQLYDITPEERKMIEGHDRS